MRELELYFQCATGKKYAIAVKNATDAITMVVRKVYEPGMTIILPNFGAYPTAVACRLITDKIYYVDVDDTFTIDTQKLPEIKNGIIIPVHLFGNNCDMETIMAYAKAFNHIVIEDCAQSTGNGSGKLGDYSVFSFYPTKPLASMGDGGMICTNHENGKEFYSSRFYGQDDGIIKSVGVNSRMDEFQCAVVCAKKNSFHHFGTVRQTIANRYSRIIGGMRTRGNCVYHQYPIITEEREAVISAFEAVGIPTMIHYPNHVSEMKALKGVHNKVGFRVSDKILSIPIHPFLTGYDVDKICGVLNEIA